MDVQIFILLVFINFVILSSAEIMQSLKGYSHLPSEDDKRV